MRQRKRGLGLTVLALAATIFISMIPAAQARHSRSSFTRSSHHTHHRISHGRHRHVLQCVAYVKQATNFNIRGNARDWWGHAEGVYDRGVAPETGAVLAFRPTRRMPLGHVAVVHSVLDTRTILIDQSHWASNGISRNVRVVDVSANNDWSEVRVALNGHTQNLGSIYPTHGFIYARSPREDSHEENGSSFVARNNTSLKNSSVKSEVASAPHNGEQFFDDDAPHRALR